MSKNRLNPSPASRYTPAWDAQLKFTGPLDRDDFPALATATDAAWVPVAGTLYDPCVEALPPVMDRFGWPTGGDLVGIDVAGGRVYLYDDAQLDTLIAVTAFGVARIVSAPFAVAQLVAPDAVDLYWPTFFVRMLDGSGWVLDVFPAGSDCHGDADRFDLMTDVCSVLGWRYSLRVGADDRRREFAPSTLEHPSDFDRLISVGQLS